jgi:exoribonuclease R
MSVLQAEGGDILIAGQESRNRTVDGDVVVVELLPKSQWKSKATHLVLNEQEKVIGLSFIFLQSYLLLLLLC